MFLFSNNLGIHWAHCNNTSEIAEDIKNISHLWVDVRTAEWVWQQTEVWGQSHGLSKWIKRHLPLPNQVTSIPSSLIQNTFIKFLLWNTVCTDWEEYVQCMDLTNDLDSEYIKEIMQINTNGPIAQRFKLAKTWTDISHTNTKVVMASEHLKIYLVSLGKYKWEPQWNTTSYSCHR